MRTRTATNNEQKILDSQNRELIESCFADAKYIFLGEALAKAYGYKVNLVNGKRVLDSKNPNRLRISE